MITLFWDQYLISLMERLPININRKSQSNDFALAFSINDFTDLTRTRTGINRLGGGCPIQLCYEAKNNTCQFSHLLINM